MPSTVAEDRSAMGFVLWVAASAQTLMLCHRDAVALCCPKMSCQKQKRTAGNEWPVTRVRHNGLRGLWYVSLAFLLSKPGFAFPFLRVMWPLPYLRPVWHQNTPNKPAWNASLPAVCACETCKAREATPFTMWHLPGYGMPGLRHRRPCLQIPVPSVPPRPSLHYLGCTRSFLLARLPKPSLFPLPPNLLSLKFRDFCHALPRKVICSKAARRLVRRRPTGAAQM